MGKVTAADDFHPAINSPGRDAALVTPNDSTDLSRAARMLYIGTSGDVRIDTLDGTDIVFASVPVGILKMRCTRVYATNTTASNIIAIY